MKFLEDKGYKCWKTDVDDVSTSKHWQRRVDLDKGFDAPLCQCNEKLHINIRHHEFAIQDHEHKSCEIYICGENKDGEWCDIKIYSVKPEELEEKLDSLETKVLNMWKAFNRL